MEPLASGMNDVSAVGAIDDGKYGDPMRDPRPDFVKQEEAGWVSLGTSGR